MKIKLGMNPYGLTCRVGLLKGQPHQIHPDALGLNGFLRLAEGFKLESIEIHYGFLASLNSEQLQSLSLRLKASGLEPIVSHGPPLETVSAAVSVAAKIGAKTVRLGLIPVLCGDRALHIERWKDWVNEVQAQVVDGAVVAKELGIQIAIEDHQDLGSEELLSICDAAGESVGICLDTGNPLSVGESPMDFVRRVASRVKHIHLKDYRASFTDEGYRLVRCPIGDGAVPFTEILEFLEPYHSELTASLEPGALEARHIRMFTQNWWQGYPERSSRELAGCILAARVNRLPEQQEWRTPFELGLGYEEISDFEMQMMERSVSNMKNLRWMQ